jgi:hypothetical protein
MTMAAIGRGENEKPGMLHLVVTVKHSLLGNLGLAKCMLFQTVLASILHAVVEMPIVRRDRKAGLDAPAAFMNLLKPDAMVSLVVMRCWPAALPGSWWLPTLHAQPQCMKA